MAKSNITHLTYNIVVMGDPYCGKSSIIERYTRGKYGPNYLQTIGSEYSKKELVIDGNPIVLYVYDTAGQEDMRTVIKSVYRKAQFEESHDMPVLAVSAKKNHNIDEAFDMLSKQIFANRKRLYPGNMVTSIRVDQKQKQQSSCCT
ncbi:ras-related protein Rab-18-B-like isoform X3 [Mercenaria mercenaria]|uniref:ras-related protein Rab-18-B-like isoform X3 n=1 Tax=Mercenaria mercenaria TaxID=6596 RepID=UPI00234E7DD4|nr:ras-related protein Rab-18-B-like isoform X3 [Mercenaria mercenaria]